MNYDDIFDSNIRQMNWIPCKDRLPDDYGTYIVTVFDGDRKRVSFVNYQCRFKRWDLTGRRSHWKVTHWMDMPSPAEDE